MKTKAKYQIELAASKDINRLVITNVHLDVEAKRMIATDGRILASIPVDVEEGDTSGPITQEALKKSRQGYSAKQKDSLDIHIEANGDLKVINGKDGSVTTYERKEQGNYPNYKQVIPKEAGSVKLCFDPVLLTRLAAAIGSKGQVTLEFTPCEKTGEVKTAIKVTGCNDSEALGVLMPRRIS